VQLAWEPVEKEPRTQGTEASEDVEGQAKPKGVWIGVGIAMLV